VQQNKGHQEKTSFPNLGVIWTWISELGKMVNFEESGQIGDSSQVSVSPLLVILKFTPGGQDRVSWC
jgi:hypothetical protein